MECAGMTHYSSYDSPLLKIFNTVLKSPSHLFWISKVVFAHQALPLPKSLHTSFQFEAHVL